MQILTKSGSIYLGEILENEEYGGYSLWVHKLGGDVEPFKVHGIFPNRAPFYEATVKWRRDREGYLLGFNTKGVRTLKILPEKVFAGMILANPNGFRSTEIVKVA